MGSYFYMAYNSISLLKELPICNHTYTMNITLTFLYAITTIPNNNIFEVLRSQFLSGNINVCYNSWLFLPTFLDNITFWIEYSELIAIQSINNYLQYANKHSWLTALINNYWWNRFLMINREQLFVILYYALTKGCLIPLVYLLPC